MSLPSLTRLCVAAVDALPEDVVRSIANNYPLVKKTLEAHVLAKDSHGDSNVIADITIEVRGWISTYGRSTNRRDTVADRYEHTLRHSRIFCGHLLVFLSEGETNKTDGK